MLAARYCVHYCVESCWLEAVGCVFVWKAVLAAIYCVHYCVESCWLEAVGCVMGKKVCNWKGRGVRRSRDSCRVRRRRSGAQHQRDSSFVIFKAQFPRISLQRQLKKRMSRMAYPVFTEKLQYNLSVPPLCSQCCVAGISQWSRGGVQKPEKKQESVKKPSTHDKVKNWISQFEESKGMPPTFPYVQSFVSQRTESSCRALLCTSASRHFHGRTKKGYATCVDIGFHKFIISVLPPEGAYTRVSAASFVTVCRKRFRCRPLRLATSASNDCIFHLKFYLIAGSAAKECRLFSLIFRNICLYLVQNCFLQHLLPVLVDRRKAVSRAARGGVAVCYCSRGGGDRGTRLRQNLCLPRHCDALAQLGEEVCSCRHHR